MKKRKEEDADDLENSSDVEADAEGTEANVVGDSTNVTDINENEAEDSEGDSDQSKPQTIIDKIKSKIVSLKKSPKSTSQGGDGDKTGVTKKKGINPVILAIVVIGVGALFLIEDEAPEEAVPQAPASFKRPVRKKPVKAEESKVEEPKAEEPKAEEPKAEEPKVEEPKAEEPKAEEPKVEEPKVEDDAISTDADTPVIEETISEPETKPSDASSSSVDTVGDGQEASNDGSITDKILEDLEQQVKKDKPKEVIKEYASPPDYEYRGRGLVYNCAGKHWACVDAPSYKLCENNYSSVNFLKKKVECYPASIYQTTKGCETMQNRNVSSNQKTDFCSGN